MIVCILPSFVTLKAAIEPLEQFEFSHTNSLALNNQT